MRSGGKKRAPLPRGPAAVQRARHALGTRERPPVLATALSPEAARFWSERAWSELAAVPAMAQTSLALFRELSDGGADLDSLGALMQIGADEVKHTEMSRDVADAFGGYQEVIPDSSRFEPARLGDPTAMPLPFWLVANGCISETVSLALMKARFNHTTHEGARAVLESICKDEAVHAKIGWSLAELVLPKLPQSRRKELAEYALAMIEVVGCTFATAGLTGKAKRDARALRTVTAERGLGACPPDEADAVVVEVIRDKIMPGLTALGVPL